MFLGHFVVAMGAKKAPSRVSLGSLILAAQLADLLWPICLLLGSEVRIAPGITRVTPLDFVSYPWSHRLVAQSFGASLWLLDYVMQLQAECSRSMAIQTKKVNWLKCAGRGPVSLQR